MHGHPKLDVRLNGTKAVKSTVLEVSYDVNRGHTSY
jgi:hypothetical protein